MVTAISKLACQLWFLGQGTGKRLGVHQRGGAARGRLSTAVAGTHRPNWPGQGSGHDMKQSHAARTCRMPQPFLVKSLLVRVDVACQPP